MGFKRKHYSKTKWEMFVRNWENPIKLYISETINPIDSMDLIYFRFLILILKLNLKLKYTAFWISSVHNQIDLNSFKIWHMMLKLLKELTNAFTLIHFLVTLKILFALINLGPLAVKIANCLHSVLSEVQRRRQIGRQIS